MPEEKFMPVATMTYTTDDAALAVDQMTDAATADLEMTSMQQYTQDFEKAKAEVKGLVASVMSLHGVNGFGDKDLGDEDAARSIAREVESFKNDPDAYIQRITDDGADDEPVVQAQPVAVAAPAPVVIPVQDFGLAPQAPAPAMVEPEVRMTFVDRPAQGLFKGISSSYATVMVPTAKWDTPKPHINTPDEHYCFPGFAVKIMTSAMKRGKNVIATGDPGCGKTEFFKQFAARIGLPFTKVPFDGSLSRAEIIGSFRQIATPTGSATPFVLGLVPTLIQRPGIICFDEVDQADPDIQYMLHSLYEGEGLTIQEDGGRFIPRHEHCRIVATANTKGRGSENGLTNAKFEMSEATRDRYPYWLNFTYLSEEQEVATIVAKSDLSAPLAKKLVGVGTAIRQGYKTGEISQPCSLRQLLDVAELSEDFMSSGPDVALALACDTVIVGRANDDDANGIREYIVQNVGVDLETLER
jgi:MoxR-like ATPase